MPELTGDVVLLICGIGVLYYGAEWLVRGSARLAASLGVSPIVVGLTIVSFGTSAPELVVCTVAAISGNPNLAIGNVMGSNLANIGLILGLTALVRPLEVHARVVWRELPLMLIITLALYPLIWDDLELSRGDGVLLLMALVAYLLFVFQSSEDEAPESLGEDEDFMKHSDQATQRVSLGDVGWVVVGSGCLVLGGYAIVEWGSRSGWRSRHFGNRDRTHRGGRRDFATGVGDFDDRCDEARGGYRRGERHRIQHFQCRRDSWNSFVPRAPHDS